ncbi:MAG: CCA tRNA nucleotidyltransferase [Patescibacteria group bacterium]|nr:CCA tRNA nucleotidyltransferase [Patescibacteria group bacterium]
MQKTSIKIVKKLREAGYEAYWAGGSVRDILMGREPKDYDIVTSARPHEIEKLLKYTIPVGKKFGVILAVVGEHHFEIATFRSDAAYTDGRRPDAVYFKTAKEDALRRDFTINGMFYDLLKKEVLDYVGGQEDLKKKILRFIGNPDERIKEDNLRILRAIRFKNALEFYYAPKTFQAIRKNAKLIINVSAERIKEELDKILKLKGRETAVRELEAAGILKMILPELLELKGVRQPEKYHKEGDVYEHTLESIANLPEKVSGELAWAILLHDIGKADTFKVKDRIRFDGHAEVGAEIADKIMRRLKFSNTERQHIIWLIHHHMILGNIPKAKPNRQAFWFHQPLFPELLELLKADALGSKPKDLSLYNKLKALEEKKHKILPKPKRLLTGNQVMRIFKIPEGPEVGRLLDEIHEAQLDHKIETKEEAIEFAKKLLKK